MYCSSCGSNQADGAAFCSGCGQPFAPGAAAVAVAAAPGVVAAPSADGLAVPLLLLPIASVVLFVLAINKVSGEFMLIQAKQVMDDANGFLVSGWGVALLGSAVLAYLDASRVGFGKNPSARGGYRWGPGQWAAGMLLLWVVSFPWYFGARRQVVGSKRRLAPAVGITILVMLVGTIAGAAVSKVQHQVDEKVGELQRSLRQMDQQMQDFQRSLGE